MTTLRVTRSAAADFQEIRQSFRQRHTDAVYRQFIAAFAPLFERMKRYPESGALVDEAREVGAEVRQQPCEQVRVIYQYDRKADVIHVLMFLPTKKNFLEHLTQRVLRP